LFCLLIVSNKLSLSRLFLLQRGDHHRHPLALQDRHVLRTAELFELDGETQELLLALVLEHDRTSAEENRGFHLGSFLEETLRVLQLELEVVLIGVGTEADLLDDDLRRIGLHLLRFLFLLIEIFLIVQDLAYGRVGLGADFDQIELELLSQGTGLGDGIDALLRDVLPDKTYLRSGDLLVDVQFVFTLLRSRGEGRFLSFRLEARRLRSVRRCDK